MSDSIFTKNDLEQLEGLGIAPAEARRQIELFRDPPPPARLVRPCTVGDGIVRLAQEEQDELMSAQGEAAAASRLSKFVPASGAASRMFKTLLAELARHPPRDVDALAAAAGGDASARDTLRLLDEMPRFAFADATLLDAARRRDPRTALEHLLEPEGLGYGERPKGLIRFHAYGEETRTAFEEQLVEAAEQVRDADRRARAHFTVSPEHREGFSAVLDTRGRALEERFETRFMVAFSEQSRSTDTLAVDMDDEPFRLDDGRLLLRPGGHGALIENLQHLDADIVLVKNIDNVVPDDRKAPTHLYKKLLVGLYLKLEGRIHALIAALEEGEDPRAVEEAQRFVETELRQDVDASGNAAESRRALIAALDRPLRVAGVVPNQGEPGGGPFWVRDGQGRVSAQIVEGSQIDPDSEEQQSIRQRATHFNPVDLVCGLLDRRGRPFDLERYVDPRTAFIAKKSRDGRALKALERPGLWNGAMAYWNTVFVEVPIETFAPVKTVFDLLRPEHQPR
jgi:hypothetical protein